MEHERTPLVQVVHVVPRRQHQNTVFRRFCTSILGIALVVVVIVTLLSVAFVPSNRHRHHHHFDHWHESSVLPGNDFTFSNLSEIILKTPNETKIREWSEFYTSGPHLAGKNLSQALWTRERWEEFGVKSEIIAYDVYINYPLDHRLALLNRSEVIYECSLEEDILKEDTTSGLIDRIPTFHGYSASGNVTAEYVYVNFGTYQDFDDLVKANVSLQGKIALAKYGRIFRGLKVKRAQELGMIGMVLYSDPQEDGEITEENGYKPYPKGVAGTLPGDPTTPGYPSKPGCPRADPHDSIPHIPSLPISYSDALPLLKALNGHGQNVTQFNKYWQGGGLEYKGIKYNIGPSSLKINLMNLQEYVYTPLWNVVGVINGTIPDEVIVLGNHRDAWIAGGAGDPNSGSAAMNELIRTFGIALKAGWKPLRTIIFASWDGEEYGLVGSTEWVEEFMPWLDATVVAYLNVDVGTRGTQFEAAASPLLNQLLYDVTKLVTSPNQTVPNQTVFDLWDKKIRTMGSGSDFTAFQDFVGIPCIDMGFGAAPKDPVYHYHSNYDSFSWMEKFGDAKWEYHTTITKVWALLAAVLSERPVLPLRAADYANGLKYYLETVKKAANSTSTSFQLSSSFDSAKFNFTALDVASTNFLNVASHYDAYASELLSRVGENIPWWRWWSKLKLYYEVRAANLKLKTIERQFIYAGGLDKRPVFKHVVFAPGRWTGYAGATFPGLIESFEDGNITNARRWEGIILERLEAARKLLA